MSACATAEFRVSPGSRDEPSDSDSLTDDSSSEPDDTDSQQPEDTASQQPEDTASQQPEDTGSGPEDTTPDTSACQPELDETFTAAKLPSGWTIDNGGGSHTWVWKSPSGTFSNKTESPSGEGHMYINSYGVSEVFDDRLVSPSFCLAGVTAVTLHYCSYFSSSSDETAAIEVSVNGGAFQQATTVEGDTSGCATLDLTGLALPGTTARLGFHWIVPTSGMYWQLDDLKVTAE